MLEYVLSGFVITKKRVPRKRATRLLSSTVNQRLMVVSLTKLRPLPSGSSEREHEPSH